MSDTFDHEGDAWASLEWDDTPTTWYPKPKMCNYCGAKNLFWKNTPQGWRLAKGGQVHKCPSYNVMPPN